jgi:hypothetical protein
VALESNAEDPESYIEKANPDHPSLIDTRHRVAELYSIQNVPTAIWIDENQRIVRPNDVVFGNDTFDYLAGLNSSEHRQALRKWVREGDDSDGEHAPGDRTKNMDVPSEKTLQARNEYRLGQWLHQNGYEQRGKQHLDRATELQPDNVTVRRGTMRMRGQNPMGVSFFWMVLERWWKGLRYYNPLRSEE